MGKSEIMRNIGMKIRQLRKERRISIEELASRCQIHYNYLGDIERGKRTGSAVEYVFQG